MDDESHRDVLTWQEGLGLNGIEASLPQESMQRLRDPNLTK